MHFTSKLIRAQKTGELILKELDQVGLKTIEDAALNERNYGDRLSQAFKPKKNRFTLDLRELAKIQFSQLGVHSVYGDDRCTFSDEKSFFSFRRDRMTGRNASMIWLR